MTNAYDPGGVARTLLMLGGSLAALAGLLFVAMSIQIAVIRRRRIGDRAPSAIPSR